MITTVKTNDFFLSNFRICLKHLRLCLAFSPKTASEAEGICEVTLRREALASMKSFSVLFRLLKRWWWWWWWWLWICRVLQPAVGKPCSWHRLGQSLCPMISKGTHTHTHACTHAHTHACTHMHTCTHACTHTRTHAHTHTHTSTKQ